MPGYLPDGEPQGFTDWESARDYIAGAIRDTAESIEDETEAEPYEAEASRIEALEDESEFGETIGQYHYWISAADDAQFEDDSDAQEYRALESLANEAEGCAADWQYGETLIRDSYFKEYAMELADDIGAVKSDAGWPNNCIDWDQAARELQMDYTSVDFDGVTYWIR